MAEPGVLPAEIGAWISERGRWTDGQRGSRKLTATGTDGIHRPQPCCPLTLTPRRKVVKLPGLRHAVNLLSVARGQRTLLQERGISHTSYQPSRFSPAPWRRFPTRHSPAQ